MVTAYNLLLAKFLEEFMRLLPHDQSFAMAKIWCVNYCNMYHHEEFDFDVKSMEDLFIRLASLTYCNFLNIGLLEHLAAVSKNECLQISVDNYNRTFNNVKVKEAMNRINVKVLEGTDHKRKYDTVFVKLINKGITYGRLKQFTVALSHRVLYVQVNSMIKKSFKRGYVIIGFLIPSCLSGFAYHAACSNTAAFAQLRMKYLKIRNYKIQPSTTSRTGTYVCCIVYVSLDMRVNNWKSR